MRFTLREHRHSHYQMLLLQLHVGKLAGLASYACAGVHVTQLDVLARGCISVTLLK